MRLINKEDHMSTAVTMNWLAPEEAMKLLGITGRVNYNRMCRDGIIKAKKFGRTWYVHKSEFE